MSVSCLCRAGPKELRLVSAADESRRQRSATQHLEHHSVTRCSRKTGRLDQNPQTDTGYCSKTSIVSKSRLKATDFERHVWDSRPTNRVSPNSQPTSPAFRFHRMRGGRNPAAAGLPTSPGFFDGLRVSGVTFSVSPADSRARRKRSRSVTPVARNESLGTTTSADTPGR